MNVLFVCAACGDEVWGDFLREVEGDVAALLGVRQGARVCRCCADRAERELDQADDDAALASDPDFVTVCDARRDAWIAALEAETAEQWAAIVRVGADVLDAEVAL